MGAEELHLHGLGSLARGDGSTGGGESILALGAPVYLHMSTLALPSVFTETRANCKTPMPIPSRLARRIACWASPYVRQLAAQPGSPYLAFPERSERAAGVFMVGKRASPCLFMAVLVPRPG